MNTWFHGVSLHDGGEPSLFASTWPGWRSAPRGWPGPALSRTEKSRRNYGPSRVLTSHHLVTGRPIAHERTKRDCHGGRLPPVAIALHRSGALPARRAHRSRGSASYDTREFNRIGDQPGARSSWPASWMILQVSRKLAALAAMPRGCGEGAPPGGDRTSPGRAATFSMSRAGMTRRPVLAGDD